MARGVHRSGGARLRAAGRAGGAGAGDVERPTSAARRPAAGPRRAGALRPQVHRVEARTAGTGAGHRVSPPGPWSERAGGRTGRAAVRHAVTGRAPRPCAATAYGHRPSPSLPRRTDVANVSRVTNSHMGSSAQPSGPNAPGRRWAEAPTRYGPCAAEPRDRHWGRTAPASNPRARGEHVAHSRAAATRRRIACPSRARSRAPPSLAPDPRTAVGAPVSFPASFPADAAHRQAPRYGCTRHGGGA